MRDFFNRSSIQRRFGFGMGVGLILLYGLLFFIGFGTQLEIRSLYLLVIGIVIYFGIKRYKSSHSRHLGFFRLLTTGMTISAIGSFAFAFFLFLLMNFNSAFFNWLIANESMGRFFNPFFVPFIVFIECFYSGLMFTYLFMNSFESDEEQGHF